MIDALGKGSLASVRDDVCQPDITPTSNVAVLKLSGSIGQGEAISVQGVRQFIDTIGKAERVHLIINSDGGKIAEADKIYGILRSLPLPISAEVKMKAWSAAVTILLAADFRWARTDASILIHRARTDPANWSPKGKLVTASDLMEQARKLNNSDRAETDLLAFRTGYKRDWFDREQSTEEFLSDNDALCCGLLHAIEGKVPFSLENLATLDRFAPAERKPSELLTHNYRAAAAVAELTEAKQ